MSYKICVSGAAVGECVNDETIEKAEELGKAIARSGSILVTGATTGIPFYAARGAKKLDGVSIGFSPADTLPLTKRVKFLMMIEAFISLIIIGMVASRAISLLT